MNKLKNNAWFRKAGMALLDIVLIVLSVYLSMELRFEMYIPSRHMETMYAAMPMVVVVYMACYVLGGILLAGLPRLPAAARYLNR